ncbi:MAG TPA: hypothetical protein VKA80_09420 [Beijerinckiaceae bacterium]|nr:hypothetical protein [Beijerinckiaceae bacterium]
MRILRSAAMAFAIVGGFLALPNGPASAAPIGAGALPLAQEAGNPLIAKAGWRHRGFHHRHHWRPYRHGFYRHHWRPHRHYGFYRPYRHRPVYGIGWGYRPVVWGGPRLVCRWRPGPWGPRQVCWRRW